MPDQPAPAPAAARRRAYRTLPAETRLALCRKAVDAFSAHADFRAAMATAGYDAADVAAFAALVTAVEAARDALARANDAARAATERQRTAFARAEAHYATTAGLARTAFPRARHGALALTGLPDRQADRVAHLRTFYTLAPDHADALAEVGISAAMIAAGRTLVDAAEAAYLNADRLLTEARDAATRLTNATTALDGAMTQMQQRGRVVLRNRPQLLEHVGLR